MTRNLKAFLDMLAWSELGSEILAQSENGYNVLAGSLPGMVITFSSYSRHPGVLVDMDGKPGGLESTAAGRYQILGKTWRDYRELLGLKGFWPEDQDKIALQLIKECRALNDIEQGRLFEAAGKCKSRWASLPGAGYGQHENKYQDLMNAYLDAGGSLVVA